MANITTDVRLKMVGKVYPAFFKMDFQQAEMRKSINGKKNHYMPCTLYFSEFILHLINCSKVYTSIFLYYPTCWATFKFFTEEKMIT